MSKKCFPSEKNERDHRHCYCRCHKESFTKHPFPCCLECPHCGLHILNSFVEYYNEHVKKCSTKHEKK